MKTVLFVLFLLAWCFSACATEALPLNAPPATQAARVPSPVVSPSPIHVETPQMQRSPSFHVLHPTLGATLDTWEQFYGEGRKAILGGEHLALYNHGSTAITIAYDPGHQERSFALTIQVPPRDPGVSSLLSSFAPFDRIQILLRQTTMGQVIVYKSLSLAHMFPASYFTDQQGTQIAPGTWSIRYNTPNQRMQIITLALGDTQ